MTQSHILFAGLALGFCLGAMAAVAGTLIAHVFEHLREGRRLAHFRQLPRVRSTIQQEE